MRVALYQILYLDKIPDYAAVNEAVDFVKKLQGKKPADLTNAVLRNIIRNKNGIRYPDTEDNKISFFAAYYSHPSWMVKRWVNRYGEEFTEELLKANNKKPSLHLRVNRLKTNTEELQNLLDGVQLKYNSGKYLDTFIRLQNLTNITDWKYFSAGYFSVQDESTGFACYLLDPKPGMRVLDLCAAPGGKTGLLADLMGNSGELTAIDKYESRIKLLNNNLQRLGVTNARLIEADSLEFNEGLYDRVLVDVPCSGLGTLTKKPDIKWKRDIGDFRKLNDIQYNLLISGSKRVDKGGFIVYSTCTIEPEENYYIIEKFLAENTNFELAAADKLFDKNLTDSNGCLQTYPHIHDLDGAFAAKLKRIN
jgi:16S rRNA (cytosine967-C5)-methyltransferase